MFRAISLTIICILMLGCVSKPAEVKIHAPSLMIAQNGDGEVTIAWESEPDYLYTIYYQSSPRADWKVLRTADRVRGTGQMLTVSDRVNPNKALRRYRVLAEKQAQGN